MTQRLRAFIFIFAILLPYASKADVSTVTEAKDQFNGDQTLYELSYAADFELDFVARLTSLCTGTAAPFIIAKFPNPSLQVKRKLLGFKLGFVSKNPYTGTRLSIGVVDDARRPARAAEIAAQKMASAANNSESRGYLCDAYLWDAFEHYANTQLELVKYAVEVLKKENRSSDLVDFLSDVEPLFARMQKLVNGDPNTSRKWSYDLGTVPPR